MYLPKYHRARGSIELKINLHYLNSITKVRGKSLFKVIENPCSNEQSFIS